MRTQTIKTTPGTLPERGLTRSAALRDIASNEHADLSAAILPGMRIVVPGECHQCRGFLPAGYWVSVLDHHAFCGAQCADEYVGEAYGVEEDEFGDELPGGEDSPL